MNIKSGIRLGIVHFFVILTCLCSEAGEMKIGVDQLNEISAVEFQAVIDAAASDDTLYFDENSDVDIVITGTPITIDKNVTIENRGSGSVMFNGDESSRLLSISVGAIVIIDAIGFQNGYSADSGGAIYNQGSLTLQNTFKPETFIEITNNIAVANGGAIYSTGSLTLSRYNFTSNQAVQGGAITVSGILNVGQSHFTGNSVTDSGGAIMISAEEYFISESTFTSNVSQNNGGAIFVSTNGEVSRSTFDSNESTQGSGGAVYQSSNNSTLVVNQSTFFNNTARLRSGDIYINGLAEVDESTFYKNRAFFEDTLSTHVFANITIENSIVEGDIGFENNIIGRHTWWSGGLFNGTNNIAGTIDGQRFADIDLSTQLVDNGGSTQTLSLGGNSILLNNSTKTGTDQRGYPLNNGARDIGAFEYYAVSVPVLAIDTLLYAAGTGVQYIDQGLSLHDAANDVTDFVANIESATIQITANYAFKEDTLGATGNSNISVSYDSGQGLLTLSGASTVDEYQAVLRTLTFETSSFSEQNTRTLEFQIKPVGGEAVGFSSSVDVTAGLSAEVNITAAVNRSLLNAFLQTYPEGTTYYFNSSSNITIDISSGGLTKNPIYFGKDTKIENRGTGKVTFEGGDSSQLFQNHGNFLIFENLYFKNARSDVGSGRSPNGGAIYNNGNILFSDCTFDSNHSGNSLLGGAIYNDEGSDLSFDNCILESNTSTGNGGAIYSLGDVYIRNTNFYDNSSEADGGAIYSVNGTSLTITVDSTFYDNTASVNGGAVYSDGELYESGSTYMRNIAQSGGAIYNSGIAELKDGSKFQRGNVSDKGGAIYNTESAELGIDTVLFWTNDAGHSGGAVYSLGALAIDNSFFIDSSSKWGGAIYTDSLLTISDTEFSSNTADHGGALLSSDELTLERTTFKNNAASGYGGAVYHSAEDNETGAASIFNDSTFEENKAKQGGGAFYTGTELTVNRCTFDRNSVEDTSLFKDSNGGAILVIYENMEMSINQSTFIGNDADGFGGAVYSAGLVNFDGVTLYDNNADDGEAFASDGNGEWNITNTLISGSIEDVGSIAANHSWWSHGLFDGSNNISGTVSGQRLADLGLATTLADNGGYTETLKIDENSILRDAGTGGSDDQRGFNRNGARDIGAYEYDAFSDISISDGVSISYQEGDGPVVIAPDLVLTDDGDTTINSATVLIIDNYTSDEDVLSYTSTEGINGSFNNGVLTLSGGSSLADYQAVLRTVTYENTSGTPVVATRSVLFVITSPKTGSETEVVEITIESIVEAPVLSGASGFDYTENDGAVIVDSSMTLNDADDANIDSARIQISANYMKGEDFLSVTSTPAITSVWDEVSGTLTLTGRDTVENYQGVLQSVAYENSSEDPATDSRSITFVVNDGEADSNELIYILNVISDNDTPVLVSTIPDRVNDDADSVSYDISGHFSDLEDQQLKHYVFGLPSGLTTSETGVISGVIDDDASEKGRHEVSVAAIDSGDLYIVDKFIWNISNAEPVLASPIVDIATTDNATFNVDASVHFSDPDNGAVIFSEVGLPEGLSISDGGVISGVVAGNASQVNGGNYSVTVTADDGDDGQISDSFTLSVTNVVPVIVTGIADQDDSDNAAVNLDIAASFFDEDVLSFSAAGLPQGLSMSEGGLISGTIAVDASQLNDGIYTVSVTANDNQGGTVSGGFTYTVSNADPAISTPISDLEHDDGATVSLDISAHFVDEDDLNLSVSGLPQGLSMSDAGLISGTVDTGASQQTDGVYTVTVTADDGQEGVISDNFIFTISNVTPTLTTSIPAQKGYDIDSVSFDISGYFSDEDTLSFSATDVPSGLSISEGGLISGTLASDASVVSPYTVVVTADDSQGGTISGTFNFDALNIIPLLVGEIPAQNAMDSLELSFDITSYFSDEDSLTFSGENIPDGLDISEAGLISGAFASDASQTKAFSFIVVATDSQGDKVSTKVSYSVSNPAPIIVTEIEDQSVSDIEAVNLDISAAFEDPDGDELTFSAEQLPDGLSISEDGVINGIVAGDASEKGVFYAAVTADDGQGGSIYGKVNFYVTNVAPRASTEITDQAATDGYSINFAVATNFVDPDEDGGLSFSVTGLPAGLSMSESGVISGTIDTKASEQSPYTVTVTAADPAGDTGNDTFVFTVNNISPVTKGEIPAQSGIDSNEFSLDIAVYFEDPDADGLTFSATNLPEGLSVSEEGQINGDLASNASVNSPYAVAITAHDGVDSVTQNFSFNVDNISPEIRRELPDSSAIDYKPFSLSLSNYFTDPDNDDLEISFTGAPEGLQMSFFGGAITGVVDGSASANSPYTITVTASDNQGGSVSQSFVLTVLNQVPVQKKDLRDQVEYDDGSFSYAVFFFFEDDDNDELTYTATGLPEGIEMLPFGEIDGDLAPDASLNSPYFITVTADDNEGGQVSASFTLIVHNVIPDVDSEISDQNSAEGEDIDLEITSNFDDDDNDQLFFTATGLPHGLTISEDGVLTGTISSSASLNSPYTVVITADDKEGGTISDSFEWTVDRIGAIVKLVKGYNLVSIDVVPDNTDMETILSGIIEEVEFVEDADRNKITVTAGVPDSDMGEWNSAQGYLIKMKDAADLTVPGTTIEAATGIPLKIGLNLIPVYGDTVDAEDALSAIPGLELVRNSKGQTMREVNGNWVNNIGNLLPGQSYLIKVTDSSTFYYQQPSK